LSDLDRRALPGARAPGTWPWFGATLHVAWPRKAFGDDGSITDVALSERVRGFREGFIG